MPAQEIIPSNIAKTDDVAELQSVVAKTDDIVALEALSAQIQTLNDTMLYMVTAILDKMPRLDTVDRAVISMVETTMNPSGNWYISSINNPFTAASVPLLSMPWNLSDAGAQRIYNGIVVS